MSTDAIVKIGLTVPFHCPVRLQVRDDPLGSVNKIISLTRADGSVIKSVLHPVPAGAEVKIGYDPPRITLGPGWGLMMGGKPAPAGVSRLYAIWIATVDGKRVLDVPEHETWPPITPPPPPPLWQRMRSALREQMRTGVDSIAKRLGYHRDEDCGGWDE